MNMTLFTSRSKSFFVAIVMMAAMVAGVALGFTEVSAEVLESDSSVTICHATAAQDNPYTTPPVNVSGVLGSDNPGNAHDSHELDIIPAFEYNIGDGVQSYPGRNWDATGQAIWNNNCKIPPPPPPPPVLPAVDLGEPSFLDATCELFPAVLLPPPTLGVTYAYDPDPAPGVTVTVTATLNAQTHQWGTTEGWEPSPPGNATVLSWSFTFADPDCREPALLGAFLFIDATCDGGPVFNLPANGNGVTYSQDVAAAPGVTVTVTATLNTETHVWGNTDGWLPNPPGDATQLTRSFTFSDPACPTPSVTETPTGTVSPTPTSPATEAPTSTATETPTATATNTPTATSTTPASNPPTKEAVAKPVSGLPNTGAGDESSPVGTVLIVAAIGVAAVGGAALVIGDRKRA